MEPTTANELEALRRCFFDILADFEKYFFYDYFCLFLAFTLTFKITLLFSRKGRFLYEN